MLSVISGKSAQALPMLDAPYSLPTTFTGIITIYPDSENTSPTGLASHIRRYWLLPSTARIVRKPDGKLALGFVHSGLSSVDPIGGISGLLNVTCQPYIDDATVQSAKTLIETKDKQEDPASTSTFNFISPTETTAKIMVGGQYLDWNSGQQTTTVIPGGSVEAGIPFQVKLTDSFDTRCIAQAGGDDAAIFGTLFTMKFKGVGNPVHFIITAKLQDIYTHYAQQIHVGGFLGFGGADEKVEYQDLKTIPSVKLQIISGTEDDIAKYHAREIVEDLLKQVQNRTGLFAQNLKANGLPNASGGGFLGWGFSAGGGFEGYDQNVELHYEVDALTTRDQTITYGLNFNFGGPEMKSYMKNLTDTDIPFPSSDDIKNAQKGQEVCVEAKIKTLQKWKTQGIINQDQFDRYLDAVITQGCLSHVPSAPPSVVPFSSLLAPSLQPAGAALSPSQKLTRQKELEPVFDLRYGER